MTLKMVRTKRRGNGSVSKMKDLLTMDQIICRPDLIENRPNLMLT